MPFGVSSIESSEWLRKVDFCMRYLYERPYKIEGKGTVLHPDCEKCRIADKPYIVRAGKNGCPFILKDMESEFYELNPGLKKESK
jgi:hypothetical protein